MNVTQRNYTVKRIEAMLDIKIKAILQENDVLVQAHNDDYFVSQDEVLKLYETNKDVIKFNKSSGSFSDVTVYIDYVLVRELLNKPSFYLQQSSNSYIHDCSKEHQQNITVLGQTRTVLNSTVTRIKRVNDRAAYAKDLVMLGDAKEALAAIEEFNSLVF